MGVVYEAHDPALDRVIALKTISLGFAASRDAQREFEERFFTEARIAARMSHPGIVVIHDAGRDPESGVLYIALELLEGRTLAETQPPLPWREALRLTRSVAEALDYAHSHKVVHRDIKPANIMLLSNGETKLMDFGIARIETARIKFNGSGQFFGTPLYMAPELALARNGDARADLFSLGAVCYALLTGRQAFAAVNIPAIVERILKEDPASPSLLVTEIPAEVDELVAHVLAKDPDERHPSARALVEDLEDVLAGRRARHSTGWQPALRLQVGVPLPEKTVKLDLEQLLWPVEAPRLPSEIETAAESPLTALVPETPRAPAGPVREPLAAITVAGRSGYRSVRWGITALSAVLIAGAFAFTLPHLAGRSPASGSAAPAAPTGDRTVDADKQTRFAKATPDLVPPRVPEPTAPTAPAVAEPALIATSPSGRLAPLLVDFEHPLKSGRLRLWVNGQIALDQRLRGRVEKKLKFIKLREGALEETLQVAPGRHEIRVAVNWDDNEKRESIVGLFREGQAKQLEIRLGRLSKNLALGWK